MRKDQDGFTLLEIIAVLAILAVMAVVSVPKLITTDETARQRIIEDAIQNLNQRERLTWSDIKLSFSWTEDNDVFSRMDYDLGTSFSWNDLNQDGGTLKFKSSTKSLQRTPSTRGGPARWKSGGEP